MPTHEQSINVALGELLEELGQKWQVRSELTGVFEEGNQRPDILVEKSDGWPIVIEAEVANPAQAEVEARSRLGLHLATTGTPIHATIALNYPASLRDHSGAALRSELRTCQFEYALISQDADGGTIRVPNAGWITGGLRELAFVVHRSSIPSWRVEALADELERGVSRAAGLLTVSHPHGSQLGSDIAATLGQIDDEGGQSRRMAMTVLADALIFHVALAEAELEVEADAGPRRVVNPDALRAGGQFIPSQILDEWQLILGVNYWPIFHTACEIVSSLPTQTASRILDALWRTTEQLVIGGVTRSHDLTGVVFQRLIADRKFLATYYTRPAAASLLAGLAMPIDDPFFGDDWADAERLQSIRVGDFACGTGTLLSTAYQRIGLMHELHGGDPRALHPAMMERGLVGLDVLTVAVHLTAAMLAGTYPETPFEGECLLTMPYGIYEWGASVGSLDLLEPQPSFEFLQAAATTAGGRGAEQVSDIFSRVGHSQFDLLIMNPPFTRHGAREGDRTEVHNPAFAAFGASEEAQNQLARRLKVVSEGGDGHGHAGLASYFVDLANKKLRNGGRLALVLPLSAMSGGSWQKIRTKWTSDYSGILAVTISESATDTRAFSADTGMAECLVVATKTTAEQEPRANFVILDAQPQDSLEGALVGQEIVKLIEEGHVARLEDGPFGGTRIYLGSSIVGEVLSCPLPAEGGWPVVGIQDITLAQTATALSNGLLWVEGMPREEAATLPIVKTREIIDRIGPHHLDLCGAQIKSDGLPQGPFERHAGCPAGAGYPTLWSHNAQLERQLIVQPDSHCSIRRVDGVIPPPLEHRAQQRWMTAAASHYNLDLQFNSQSLCVAATSLPTIGGRAWPTVVLDNPSWWSLYSLWANSTLGLLAHWWTANKTQSGRGCHTVTSIPLIPVFDLRTATEEQIASAESVFQEISDCRFLPFDQIDEDPSRALLDRRLLVDILGLPEDLCRPNGPIERLRQKLAAEPQIHGGKATRVVFTEDGEQNEPRDDR